MGGGGGMILLYGIPPTDSYVKTISLLSSVPRHSCSDGRGSGELSCTPCQKGSMQYKMKGVKSLEGGT